MIIIFNPAYMKAIFTAIFLSSALFIVFVLFFEVAPIDIHNWNKVTTMDAEYPPPEVGIGKESGYRVQKDEETRNRVGVLSSDTNMGTGYEPMRDIFYNVNGSNSDRAIFVLPRRVYYDNRLQSGKPRDVVIILLQVHSYRTLESVLACELNGHLSKSLKYEKTRPRTPQYADHLFVVQCIGLPQDAVFNGSIARVIYKKKGESFYSRVTSEKPLFLHEGSHNPPTPTKGKGSIVVCTTMYGHPDKFDQWLMYQKYLGVGQVYVSAHPSFSEGAVDIYPFLKDSLKNGFARMDIWNQYGNKTNTYNQMMKYQDCLYRHIGVFEYGFFYDYDDFFNPVLADHKDAHYYLSKFFSDDKVGTVCMQWRQMQCGPIERLVKDVPHGNLTSILGRDGHKLRKQKKCAHRLSAVGIVSVHTIQSFIGDYRVIGCEPELAYVAHNRYSIKPCKN